jgi:hypothetical protein
MTNPDPARVAFRDFTRRERCTYDEADALAWYLSQLRARKLYETLRPSPRWQRKAIAP